MLVLDHLVVAAENLRDGVAHVASCLGIEPESGGVHIEMGTHNALLSLGPGLYLEVISIDPAATAPSHARWFGLDRFSGPPRLTHWVCRTDDLEEALAHAPEGAGRPLPLSRGDFMWRMAVNPLTGDTPFDGAYPALIQWESAAHPADRLPDHGLRLEELQVRHPDTGALEVALAGVLTDPRIRIARGPRGLEARIRRNADGALLALA